MITKILPYGRSHVSFEIPAERFRGEYAPDLPHDVPLNRQVDILHSAMNHPVGTLPLRELAGGKDNIVLISSDHTRPVPSRIMTPLLLKEIRVGNPEAQITILIATGCHRKSTRDELVAKFGNEIVNNEHIHVHDCDLDPMSDLGLLPSGGRLLLNTIALQADLLIAEGFIEPHFFAGFSGGRKSVMPGIAARETVLYNHNADFIRHPEARAGSLAGNPLDLDMTCGAQRAGLTFICNVIINSAKEIVHAVAGDPQAAHQLGCDYLMEKSKISPAFSDIVIVSNGGYPLDQNIYQAVKGMSAAATVVKKGGVIIMVAESEDGCGAPEFYQTLREERDPRQLSQKIEATPRERTRVDQWQSQVFAKVLSHCHVVYLSGLPPELVEELHMIPAATPREALEAADRLLNHNQGTIVTIPDGISVIVAS
ncbi:MAG: nickel-dependent lactate racemase [Symbiobacteriaceae bacterium]|nr:nickel-dependent lactate racemase [Symbiobacteriaceae bacterium]